MNEILILDEFVQNQVKIDNSIVETAILPRERVLNFSPEDFESFICEWAVSSKKFSAVHRIGQAGDKGRDIVSFFKNGDMYYYQCKRYKNKLSASGYWIEFGKLVYYTYLEEIKVPTKFYIVAASGLTNELLNLIGSPETINDKLIENWDKCCKNKITSKTVIELDKEFKDYIKKFDFSIIDSIDIDTIIRDYSETDLFYFRFGGNKKPTRKEKLAIPMEYDLASEMVYLTQLLEVYSEWKNIKFDLINIYTNSEVHSDFVENRSYYYDAESLRRDLRDTYLGIDEFDLIKSEMHSGLKNYMKNGFASSYDKLNKVLHESTQVDLSACTSHSILNFINNNDKKGICHHLVNDDKIRWK